MNDNICLQDHFEERDRTLTRTSIQIVVYVKSSLTAIQRISNCAVGFVNHPALGSMNFLTDEQLLPTNQERTRKLMFPFFTISRGRRQLLEGLKK